MIQVNNLDFCYGRKKILNEITFDVNGGEIISIVGENGSGKSTLLSNICRLIKVDKGHVLVDEKEINQYNNNDLAKVISILKQDNHLDIKYTVYDLVAMGRFPYSKGKLKQNDIEKIEQVIDFFELETIRDSVITNLSGGQKQLVLIAMIFAQDANYLFLDEPLNNLDIKNAIKTMNIIKKYAKEFNKTVILIMHDLSFALNYSTHIAGLKKGNLVFSESIKKVIDEKLLDQVYDVEFDILNHNNQYLCSIKDI